MFFKSLKARIKESRERFAIPKGVQDVIPIQGIYADGISLVRRSCFWGENKYSKTFKFQDINYAVASREDKESMFLDYSELLNSLDSGATAKLTIIAHRLSKADFEANILIPMAGDKLDKYRRELNDMLQRKVTESNAIVLDKLITISVCKKDIEAARSYFARVGADLAAHFNQLGSKCMELSINERLKFLHDFYRPGEESSFRFDLSETMRKGHSFKDYICPDSMEIDKSYVKIGERYARTLFLKEYASYIKDSMITELTELNQNMMLSIDIMPVPTDEAVKLVENKVLGAETNITQWQRRQNANQNFSAIVPYDMEQQRNESREFLNDITTRDQRMLLATMCIVHTAATKEQLDSDTDSLLSTARKHLCQIAPLTFQQTDGLSTVLPFGQNKILNTVRTLTTESLAVLMPFKVQEVLDRGGLYYGLNAISNNLIVCMKEFLQNPNAFRLGVPGSGKSFGAKMELVMIALMFPFDDILVCDPEAEYCALIKAMGGEVIRIAAGSDDHINALDMVEGYGEGNDPVIDKLEFVCSLFEQLGGLEPEEKSIVDRCVRNIYDNYQAGGKLPTLVVLYEELLTQPEPEAKRLALKLELFTNGSLNVFAHKTNVDVNNRIIDYNIMDLGSQLKTMGLLVITDAMINRVTENWRKGKRTHIFLDEFHVVFENPYSGAFFNSAWRRFRKRNAYPTGITQNVEYLLDSVLASSMLSNSEFIVMHNQAAADREKLAKLLNISNEQMSYITNAKEGCGLIRIGSALVPFINKFPTDTELYRLMTTKPNEKIVD
ncbi:MAG: TraE family protein [Ethanoligenens sp.]